ncbi:NADPH-dependent F420 reductase [Oenococcus alcoholitolerans]|uniref:Pyrroline-5-carboxylate reductase catalytic N-terminal domain-containing protein n=1 Tax=Oenococcus alcoholitolerans TaxID=931074 RepID=A0ABR4XPP2_9LACO|nr:hypothetical protein Q757_07425 [Oenococcus alcoholitolerans]
MIISFIGSGQVGRTLGDLFAKAGHKVILTNSRGKKSLERTVITLGENVFAGDQSDVRKSDLVVLATPFYAIEELDPSLLEGKIVVDATNYFPDRDGKNDQLISRKTASSRFVSDHFKNARVVKAFNILSVAGLSSLISFEDDSKRKVFPLAGDDVQAKKIVSDLIEQIGFAAYDVGSLDDSLLFQSDSPLFLFSGTLDEWKRRSAS